MLPRLAAVTVALLAACGGSPARPAATPAPAATSAAPVPDPAAQPSPERCKAAIAHRDDIYKQAEMAAPATEDQQLAREQAIEQARAAGILGGPADDCPAHWTNARVDCVLAAKDPEAADACDKQAR